MTETPAPTEETELTTWLDEERAFGAMGYPMDELVAALSTERSVEITGASGTYLDVVLADVFKAVDRPVALILPTPADARAAARALEDTSSRQVIHLPTPDVSPYAGATPDRGIIMKRLNIAAHLKGLNSGQILVASALAWSRRVVPPETLIDLSMRFEIEDDIDVDWLQETLVAAGYNRVSTVEDAGTFSVRGGIIDLFSPSSSHPVRIELYGDMIESIREVDQQTQRSGNDLEHFEAVPVREVLFSDERDLLAREKVLALAGQLRIPTGKLRSLLQDISDHVRFFGIEALLPAFHQALASVHGLLPDDTCVVIVEPEKVESRLERHLDAYQAEYEREVSEGELAFAPDAFLLTADGLRESFTRAPRRVDCRHVGLADSGQQSFGFPYLSNRDLVRLRKKHASEGAFRAILNRILPWRELYGRIAFSMGSSGAADRLATMLRNHDLEVQVTRGRLDLTTSRPAPAEVFEIFEGTVDVGYRAPARGIAVITEHELFGRTYRRPSKAMAHEATAINSFKELLVGDLIVHIDFGIGRYGGLVRMDAGGADVDFLAIEYADGDKLYLPVYRLNRVQKYVGSSTMVRIDKLGGTSWERTKARVKKQLADIAGHLLDIYAQRASQEGYAFNEPAEDFFEFEASFPYEETQHQARAIRDVLSDMVRPKPMDRLLCGDVGFGKTEVAIRAAYKAVLDGRQVAVLVPTTVLAEQHIRTFKTRLSTTAARVEGLSRFRSNKQVKQIIADAAMGKVDVLIGTHRLLSKDVEFKDLGLLIVDEEQRFGVRHKEKLKELRATVDVLTLTATPIPRTMEMAMLGIRDLSLLLTPPPGRMAIATHVAKFKPAIIREGIEREIDRGGQVYFVHNRVETIHNLAAEIQRIVPKARIAVGHAQMPDTELEEIMLQLVDHKIDVLVATTIIESGIDVSRANTMFINHADKFGLAQLHQLRGRTGRGSERAYCYLLIQDPKKLKPDAKRRLDVIVEHTDLGAGVQIAHHDLDMRGAGNLLGKDQSGHIESVGFELYTELLNEAIAELKGEPTASELESDVRLPISAYIPEEYIDDISQRLLFYKRYNMAESDEAVYTVHGEIQDRFGRAPDEVEHLKELVLLKLSMMRIRAKSIEGGPKAIVVDLMADTPVAPDQVIELIKLSNGKYRFEPEMKIVRKLGNATPDQVLVAAMRMARELEACVAS